MEGPKNSTKGLLQVYDIAGRCVMSQAVRGSGAIRWDASHFENGVYLLRLAVGGSVLSKKAVLTK